MNTKLYLIISILVLAIASPSMAESISDKRGQVSNDRIRIQSRVLVVPPDRGEALRAVTEVPAASRRHVIIQLKRTLNAKEREVLADSGIKLLQFIRNQGWYASIKGGLIPSLPILEEIRGSWPIKVEDRLDPRFQRGEFPDHAIDPEDRLILRVLAFPDADLDSLTEEIEAIGGTVDSISEPFDLLFIRISASQLQRLASIDGVHWIETVVPKPHPEMDRTRTYLKNDVVQAAPFGLDGHGIMVSVHEGKHAFEHQDLSGRWIQGDDLEPLATCTQDDQYECDHATNSAGTIAGNGALSRTYGFDWSGMAPEATIVAYAFEDEANNYADITDALQRGVDVANNSWGYYCNEATYGEYSAQARVFDLQVLGKDNAGNDILDPSGNPNPMTVVFSGGNERDGSGDGTNDCITNTTAPFINYYTINQPKPAKNIIVVGAVDSHPDRNDMMTTFSSWGPTSDGRLKPDLVAAGVHNGTVVSNVSRIVPWTEVNFDDDIPEPNCVGDPLGSDNQQCYRAPADSPEYFDYTWFGATSAAAAMVSGNAALFLEDFRAENISYYGPRGTKRGKPLPSTVKAHFIHTARDLNDAGTSWYNPGPDYASGYGLLDMEAAIDQMRSGKWIEACIDQDETHSFAVYGFNVKFTLVWDDAPGEAGAVDSVLVNDLDLIVREEASGTRHYPWTLDPANPAAPAITTTEDHINNVEVVSASGAWDNWIVEVKGHSVQEGPQCYSLVYSSSYIVPVGDQDMDGVNDILLG